jgi:hypothetical protein
MCRNQLPIDAVTLKNTGAFWDFLAEEKVARFCRAMIFIIFNNKKKKIIASYSESVQKSHRYHLFVFRSNTLSFVLHIFRRRDASFCDF